MNPTGTCSDLATSQDWLGVSEGMEIVAYVLAGNVSWEAGDFTDAKTIRYASREQARKSVDKVFAEHAGLLGRLAR